MKENMFNKFFNSIKKTYRKTFDYSSRSTRFEMWSFIIFFWLFTLIGSLSVIIFLNIYPGIEKYLNFYSTFLPLIIFYLVTLIPAISLGVRRLHDMNFSGWLIIVPFIFNILNNLFVKNHSNHQVFGYIIVIITHNMLSDEVDYKKKNKYGKPEKL